MASPARKIASVVVLVVYTLAWAYFVGWLDDHDFSSGVDSMIVAAVFISMAGMIALWAWVAWEWFGGHADG